MHIPHSLYLPVVLGLARAGKPFSASGLGKRAGGYDDPGPAPDPGDHNFHDFVTRPDIQAPRWEITVHDESSLSPGYWFVAPYTKIDQTERGPGWVAPNIFDGKGDLVWSGVDLFHGFDIYGFTKRRIAEQDMLSMTYRMEHNVLLNDNYQIHKEILVDQDLGRVDMHEFHMVDNGTRLLQLTKKQTKTSLEVSADAGYDGNCEVEIAGFEERDSETLETTFSWLSEGNIPLSDSIFDDSPVKFRCNDMWDYAHCNSLDKFADGDYLIGCRQTDTIYKISAKDGSMVWRLGGLKNDFAFDDETHFGGQHDVKILSQNDTHLTITMMDNGFRPGRQPRLSNEWSRCLILSVDTTAMTAKTLGTYDHPERKSMPGRGSFQQLPNGNVFCGWSLHAAHTEFAPDGSVLMTANTRPLVKSYRSYKFPWMGHPTAPPDVYSVAFTDGDAYSTNVWVSWNGATEVHTWSLYKWHAADNTTELIASAPKIGFETAITHKAFLSDVVVEALDREGNVVGTSNVFQTIGPGALIDGVNVKNVQWINDRAKQYYGNPVLAFFSGVAFCAGIYLLVHGLRYCWSKRRQNLSWHRLGSKRSPNGAEFALNEEETQPFQLEEMDSGDDKEKQR